MQDYIQGHHKQMLMWGKGWITELSIDLFIWRPRLEIFFLSNCSFQTNSLTIFAEIRRDLWKKKHKLKKFQILHVRSRQHTQRLKRLLFWELARRLLGSVGA